MLATKRIQDGLQRCDIGSWQTQAPATHLEAIDMLPPEAPTAVDRGNGLKESVAVLAGTLADPEVAAMIHDLPVWWKAAHLLVRCRQ
jgi:hypothetical protein